MAKKKDIEKSGTGLSQQQKDRRSYKAGSKISNVRLRRAQRLEKPVEKNDGE